MVSAKTGPVISILGSIIIIGFGIFYIVVTVNNDVQSGIEFAFIKFTFSLSVGVAGLIGGMLAFRGMRWGNIIPLLGTVMAIVGLFVPIGEIGIYNTILMDIVYAPVTLFSTLIYIDVILTGLGGLLGLLFIIVERGESKKIQELARKDEVLRKAEKALLDYLEENKGKAFTAKSLHKRCIEDTQLDVSITETKKILYDLHSLGKLRLDNQEDVNYYFAP